jgi:ERCC4-type nuclease
MFVMVDTNEQSTNPVVVARLQQVFPNLQITTLLCGDVNIILDDGAILAVERKQAGDFLGSIADGRVFRQVERMAAGAKWSCIILTGALSFDKDDMAVIDGRATNWKGASVRGAMMAIQWAGCPIIGSTEEMYPYVLNDIIQFCSKPSEHQQTLGRKRVVTFPPVELKEEIIAAFPGVGLKRAQALFEFVEGKNNPEEGASLSEALSWISAFHLIAEKSRPEGWGNKTVLNVRTALGLQPNQILDIKEQKDVAAKTKKASKEK